MNKTFKQKVIYGLTIGCITLALGGIALANEQQAPPRCEKGNMFQPGQHDRSQHISDNLKKLVEQNTIDQVQADQILAFFKEKGEQRKAEFEKMKDMTSEERTAYMDQHKDQRPDIVADLQANANLTEDQAKAVAAVIHPHHGHHGHGPGPQGTPDGNCNMPTR